MGEKMMRDYISDCDAVDRLHKGGYIDDEDRDCILKNILASIIVDFKSVVGK